MGRNVEIKARTSDLAGVRRRAAGLSGLPPELITQEDTFFGTKRGRLKLRRFDEKRGELIYYEREDAGRPTESRYMILPTAEAGPLRDALSKALGVTGIVKKSREVYHFEGTRIHLDTVEELGEFVELEAVLGPGETRESGFERVARLIAELGIEESDLVDRAYVDLLLAGETKEGD